MEALDWEICASLEEQTWQRWGTARLEEDLRGATAPILQPSQQTEFHCQTWGRNEGPHDQALKEAREAQWRALEGAHLLEQNIERLSWAASRAKYPECWHPYSCSHSRGRLQGRCAISEPPQAEEACNFSRPRGRDVLQKRSLERTLGAGDWRRRGGGEWPWPSTHPRARAGVLPRNTNNHAGSQG